MDSEPEKTERKKFAGVSRRKSITYEREEFKKTSAEEQRKERNRKKFEETEHVDDVSPPRVGDRRLRCC